MGLMQWMVLALVGCGGGDVPAPVEAEIPSEPAVVPVPPASMSLSVQQPWIRLMPPGAPNTAGFMVLENADMHEHAVVSAAADIAKSVELHTHIEEDGRMKMRRLEKVVLAPKQKVELKEGGHHVMFIGLTSELTEGQQVPVVFTLDDGSDITVKLPVLREAPSQDAAVGH